MKNILFVVALFTILASCASTPKLDAEGRAGLSEVRIDPVVESPKDMYYLGPGSGVGMMFGAVGGLITATANVSPGESLNKFAQDNGIHIDRIVEEEAAKAFRDSGKLRLTDTPSANTATMKVSVFIYGFSIPNGFSSVLVPMVGIKCALVEPDGKIVWSAKDATQALGNPVEGSTPEDFRANPKLIEASWRAAAKSLMTEIVDHM
jgi:hypothetical protein